MMGDTVAGAVVLATTGDALWMIAAGAGLALGASLDNHET
jgi:hypothetical protein